MGGPTGACNTTHIIAKQHTEPVMGGWFVATLDGMVKTAGPALVKDWTVGTDR